MYIYIQTLIQKEFIGNICLDMRKKYLYKSVEHYWDTGATQNKRFTYQNPPIEVIKKLVRDNPNDAMLGEEVRLYIRELVELEKKTDD